MPVTILTPKEKSEICHKYISLGHTKASLSEMYAVSTRTIGRVLSEQEDEPLQLKSNEEPDDGLDVSCDPNLYEWVDDEEDITEPEYEYHVVATPISIAITRVSKDYIFEDPMTVSVDPENENFSEASDIVWSGRGSQESLKEAFELIDRKTFIEKYTNGRVTVDPEVGRVYYQAGNLTQEFSGRLVSRLIECLKDGDDNIDGLIAFTERLAYNDSERAINELYGFLEASCIEIDTEGYVIAFKKVRENYFDIHSNSMDNSPGKTLEVPRRMVDDNSDRTCSFGLHVCSSSYLPRFGGWGFNRVVSVRVDPKDFVSVPRDYNNAKARVCKYEVLKDVTDDFVEKESNFY